MRKFKLFNILLLSAASCMMTACFDLNKEPEGVLSTTGAFKSVGEITNYLDQFYQNGLREQGFDQSGLGFIADNDLKSDNMTNTSVNQRLDGQFSLNNAPKLNEYRQIRNVNFLIVNLENCTEKGNPDYKRGVGEAHYFRAWYYYQLLQKYGGVTWVDQPLDPNLELMLTPRNSRTEIADKILEDLTIAAENLPQEKSSASRRLHKDVALALKSEVALFEGTWEKYHKAKNDEFYDKTVTDEKINGYLTTAKDAAKEVMDKGIWKIYSTGNTKDDYRAMFATINLDNNPEVLWYKMYDGDQIGNNVDRYLNGGGGGMGLTASLVDDYLTNEGTPFIGKAKIEAKKVYGQELSADLRDARLMQTVCPPGQKLRPDRSAYTFPPLAGGSYHQNITGYSLLKYVQIDYKGSLDAEWHGATPGIQCRYADILLNYAEALAELDGAANSAEIVKALQPLRDRVGMPGVDFDREYNTSADYPFRGLNKYVQAVRRERRVEQACEGRRLMDIFRWAAADELIVGWWPKGALFVGSNLELENVKDGFYKGALVYDQAENNLILSGKPGDPLRYIVPVNPDGRENGYAFNVHRDYLLPINQDMLNRTQGQWEQNPGWN